MGSATNTRKRRPAACAICAKRQRARGLTTCAKCARAQAERDAARYAFARDLGMCTRAGCPELASSQNKAYCETHRLARIATYWRARGGR